MIKAIELGSRQSGRNAAGQSPGRALRAYFRCPQELVSVGSSKRPEGPPGFFEMGPGTVCYGRLSTGATSSSPSGVLSDALQLVEPRGGGVDLPFDPEDVIENLHRERYTASFAQRGEALRHAVREAYYLMRPLLGVAVRRHLQKLHLRDWQKIAFPSWPVDSTVERVHRQLLALCLKAQGLEKLPFIWFWPDGYSSCTVMTHDVEESRGMEFCGQLMDIDESFGFRAAFQVIPEDRYKASKSFLESITSRGFEVNVHDLTHDGRLFAEHAEFLRRAERINYYIKAFGAQGFRSGILYRNADWYDAFRFSYDMSIPNVGHLDPQRGGCCTVMPYFIGNILELPTTCTQDYTLFHILGDYSIDLWKAQIDLIRKDHGLINFIVHPDYVIEEHEQNTYKALLKYLSELVAQGAIWSAIPGDVAAWWRQRSEMQLVEEDGKWRIEGAGKERARIAYACLNGDTVTYSMEP